jgi:hypothetical protein
MCNRKKEVNWVGHIDLNCRLKYIFERKIEGRTIRGRIRKEVLKDYKERGRRNLKVTIPKDFSGEFYIQRTMYRDIFL